MTYDAADRYVLAVSLNASAGPFNNTYAPNDITWKFSGGNWSVVPTVGQVPATLSPGLVYDAADEYVLLYGGRLMDTGASVAPLTNQTWSYHAGIWTNLSANSTAAPYSVDFANPVYDAADGYVVLYDEIGITPTDPNGFFNTTWTYVGGIWTNITATAGTPPEMLGAMTYDAADQYVLYFGGYTWWNQLSNSTWSFHGGTWANLSSSVGGAPSPRMNFGLDYDTAQGSVVLYGGLAQLYSYGASAFSYETWGYASGLWTLLSSNGTIWSIQSMTYDVADGESVLLGANSNLSAPPNVVTWVYSSGSWVVAAPLFVAAQLVTDVGRSVQLVVTQSPDAGGVSYEYTGLPPGCQNTNSPSVSCVPTAAGDFAVSVDVTGSAGFHALAQTTIVVNPAPVILGFSSTSAIGEVGIATEFRVNASQGTGALAYAYQGLPAGCAPSDTAVLSCTPAVAGAFQVTATVTDALGVHVSSAVDALQVVPPLAVSALLTNRSVIDVGQAVSVSSTLSGGDGGLGYSYVGLPAGCASADSSVITCRPSSPGSFSIALSATDALGAAAGATTVLVVNALPAVTSIAASNATIAAGGVVTIVVAVSGGTGPFQYRYSGLPAGCVSADSASVSCGSVPAGNYTIAVTVTDATGASATGTVPVRALEQSGVVSTPGRTSLVPGFWWGFALAAVAIAAAVVLGARQVYLTRQGEAIVRQLGTGTTDGPDPGPEGTLVEEVTEGPNQ